jgi:hypothetical protein
MAEHDEGIVELLRATEVGDTVRMRLEKSRLNAEVRDRISPIIDLSADPTGHTTFQGFTKDATGLWDLESVTHARGSSVVEVIIRRYTRKLWTGCMKKAAYPSG